MGDSRFFGYIDRLAGARIPLLERNGGITLTVAGRDVLAARADAVHLNGIDRWLGGVHLHGREAEWRWDEQARALRIAA